MLLLYFLINLFYCYILHFIFCFIVFCYLFDAVRYFLRKVDADSLEHPTCEVDLMLCGSMKVEADKSVTRVIYVCGTAIRRPPIGMKYEVGEFDCEL